jgi:transposase
MECVIETKANSILQCIDGLRGDLHVTFEEGTSAAWLYDLLKPHVTELIVCDPRKNKSMREGSQNDKIDARRLAELLRVDHLTPVYHGEHGLRTLKELVRSYLTITKDLARVKSRVKAIYRSWAIPCTGKQVYARCHRGNALGASRYRRQGRSSGRPEQSVLRALRYSDHAQGRTGFRPAPRRPALSAPITAGRFGPPTT